MIDHRSNVIHATLAVVKFKPEKKLCIIVSSHLSSQFHIFNLYSSSSTCVLQAHILTPPDGLIAQLVEHYTSIAEVVGLNPVRPEFFPGVSCELQ